MVSILISISPVGNLVLIVSSDLFVTEPLTVKTDSLVIELIFLKLL